MSDGDNATPDRPRLPDTDRTDAASFAGGDNQWLTRAQRPSPGAAPWERGASAESSPSGQSADATVDSPDVKRPPRITKPPNVPAGTLTVADLIAKIAGDGSGPTPTRPSRAARRYAEPDPEPVEPPE